MFAMQRGAAGSGSDDKTKLMFAALLATCFGGGAWSLRHGIRTLRILRKA